MELQNRIDWFINQTKEHKVLIILVAVLAVMYVDRNDFKQELKTLKRERRKTDSIYIARLNFITTDFQRKIDECSKERISDYIIQSEKWEKKFDELSKETKKIKII